MGLSRRLFTPRSTPEPEWPDAREPVRGSVQGPPVLGVLDRQSRWMTDDLIAALGRVVLNSSEWFRLCTFFFSRMVSLSPVVAARFGFFPACTKVHRLKDDCSREHVALGDSLLSSHTCTVSSIVDRSAMYRDLPLPQRSKRDEVAGFSEGVRKILFQTVPPYIDASGILWFYNQGCWERIN